MVCASIPADVFSDAMDDEERNLISRIFSYWYCPNRGALFAYDQGAGQVWDESLSGFGSLSREPLVSRIKSWDGNIDQF